MKSVRTLDSNYRISNIFIQLFDFIHSPCSNEFFHSIFLSRKIDRHDDCVSSLIPSPTFMFNSTTTLRWTTMFRWNSTITFRWNSTTSLRWDWRSRRRINCSTLSCHIMCPVHLNNPSSLVGYIAFVNYIKSHFWLLFATHWLRDLFHALFWYVYRHWRSLGWSPAWRRYLFFDVIYLMLNLLYRWCYSLQAS